MSTPTPGNAMTIDVEDFFQVAEMADLVPHSAWSRQPSRLERNLDTLLGLLAECGIHATFFVLGWLARRYPAMVRAIQAGGHELASHGYEHRAAALQSRVQFRRDILRSKGVLEDVSGKAVLGYRAPGFSIAPGSRWALDTLFNCGYRYSSSMYPFGGARSADPRFAFFPSGASGILELPVSTVRLWGRNLPAGGASAFRLFPYAVSRALLRHINRVERQSAVFYLQLWELDAQQVPQLALAPGARVRMFTNRGQTCPRLRRLGRDFQWDRIDNVFPVLR